MDDEEMKGLQKHPWIDGIRWLGKPERDGDIVTYPAVELEPLSDDDDDKNFTVFQGDDVRIDVDEEPEGHCIGRVAKLFERNGERKFKVRWFYRIVDTNIMVDGNLPVDSSIGRRDGLEGRRLWLAEDNEEYTTDLLVGTITRVVKVNHVNPGDPAPGPEECDYWYNQMHTMQHYTFRDCYANGAGPPKHPDGREIIAIDLFSGCGGMSFLGQTQGNVTIKSKHAVDINHDALLSFKANQPHVNIHEMGVEEFLFLCRHANELYKRHLDTDPDDSTDDYCKFESDFEDKMDVDGMEGGGCSQSKQAGVQSHSIKKRSRSSACRGRSKARKMSRDCPYVPKKEYNVEEIVDIRLKHSVKRVDKGQEQGQLAGEIAMETSWLEFTCQTNGGTKSLKSSYLEAHHPDLFKTFIKSMRNRIPRPGDIGLIMGGPPCQGVSGFNRHAKRSSILSCLRNAQVKAFYRTIEFFNPAYALMENVLDIFKKEEGAYAKYATAQLLALGYQSRMGVIAAGDHGCPQTRYRCFLWGAKSGEEILPPFPEPTFDCKGIHKGPIPELAKCCHVTFLNEENRAKAWPSTVNGDILSDLPAVSNFSFAEALEYKSEPETALQAWLRREPPFGQLSRLERGTNADGFMQGVVNQVKKAIKECCQGKATEEDKKIAVSDLARCRKVARKNDFAAEVWNVAKASMPVEEMQLNRDRMLIHFGGEILEQMRFADKTTGPLRDHRPRMCNMDDIARIMAVPPIEGKGYRSMAGVVVNDDGTTCAGHSHAFKGYGCKGGGVAERIKRCTGKEGRVDHAERGGWRGVSIPGCSSMSVFLPSMDLLCPRWAISTKDGRNVGRSQCFGRIELKGAQPTVVTRAEPHNIQISHHEQSRVLTIRENARCQGFPDYYALVGTGKLKQTLSRIDWVDNRYTQIGNAVSPQVAMALGRGLALAAGGIACPAMPVVHLPDAAMDRILRKAVDQGKGFFNSNRHQGTNEGGKENRCMDNEQDGGFVEEDTISGLDEVDLNDREGSEVLESTDDEGIETIDLIDE